MSDTRPARPDPVAPSGANPGSNGSAITPEPIAGADPADASGTAPAAGPVRLAGSSRLASWFGSLLALGRNLRGIWRRSLMIRVVSATLALGILVLLVVGQFLLQKIATDLVESARSDASNNALQLTRNTAASYDTQKFDDNHDFKVWVNQKMYELYGPPDAPLRRVVLLKELDTPYGPVNDQGLGVEPSAVPRELRERVTANAGSMVSQELSIPVRVGSSYDVSRVIVVGSLVDFGSFGANNGEGATGRYELYFVYPLDREVAVLADVQRTFVVGAIALLLLIGLVAWVVTRQVVTPVRTTARAAEQLASGALDRRVPVRGEDDLARLGGAFNDMAASLETQIHQLEALSLAQRRFVSDVSHELRTPLTTIRMAGDVIFEARPDLDPTLARTAELLQTQLDRFELLLSDLLEVSRFDAGAAMLEVEPVDLRALVDRAVEHLRPLADTKGIMLTVNAPNHPAIAEVDSRRVERVLRNLVGNAIEHGEGRPVQVTVATDAAAVAIGVRDHGVGLAPADVRRVFDRFWRADPARARSTGGTGLGLAISLEDSRLHGGWLQAWGELGNGAHFRLTLPRRPGEPLASSPLRLVPDDASPASRLAALTSAEGL